MERRKFVGNLTRGIAGLSIGLKAAHKKENLIFLTKFYIAGFSYYQGSEAVVRLNEGDKLVLKQQPDNPYDRRALEIYTAWGAKLGYVPRSENPIPSRVLRQNYKLKVFVDKINNDASDYFKIRLALYMEID